MVPTRCLSLLDSYPRVSIVGRGSRDRGSVSNRKELVDLGIFVTLPALIDHGRSLPKLFYPENGPSFKKSGSIFQNEAPCAF